MLLSIFVYSLTGLILYGLGRRIAFRDKIVRRISNRATSFWCPEIALLILTFALVAGFRYDVGVDHLTYLRFYEDLMRQGWIARETLEPGFVFIMKVFSSLNLHFFFFFAFLGAIQIFFFYYAFKDEKYLYPYFGLIIMLTPLFLTWMNGIRQSIVCCIFVFLVKYIKERKLLIYVVGIVLAALIHRSAYILLPLYFVFRKDFYLKNRYINILIVVFCAILGASPTWSHLILNLQKIFSILDYESYADNIATIIEETRDMSWGPVRILLFVTNLCIIWFYPKTREKFPNHRVLNLYFVLFFIGVALYNLFVETGILFTRPLMYFTIFTYVMMAYTLYGLSLQRRKRLFVFFLCLSLLYVYMMLAKLYFTGVEVSTSYYKFYF